MSAPSRMLCRFARCLSLGLAIATQSMPVAGDLDRPALPPEVQRVLAWLPENTETLFVAQAFLFPAKDVWSPRDATLAQGLALDDLVFLKKGKLAKPLAGRKIRLAVRGCRNFSVVSSFGSVRSEGCAVIVIEEELGTTAREWTDLLRAEASAVWQIAGRDVFVFPSGTLMEPWVKPTTWQGSYLVLLQPDTVLCASSDRYLEEVLKRVDAPAEGRALPADLPEWKDYAPTARGWMLRRVPPGSRVRLIQGIVWTTTAQGFEIVMYPLEGKAQQAISQARVAWAPFLPGKTLNLRQRADGAILIAHPELDEETAAAAIWMLYSLQAEDGTLGLGD